MHHIIARVLYNSVSLYGERTPRQLLKKMRKQLPGKTSTSFSSLIAFGSIVQSYLPGGADMHSHPIHDFLPTYESVPKRNLDRFIRFCTVYLVSNT